MDKYRIKLTFIEPLLGTVPLDKKIFTTYVQSQKEPKEVEDELETLTTQEELERGTCGFHRENGQPILYNYVFKGWAKDACSMLRRVESTRSAKLRAYRKVIDGLLFVKPRRIPITLNGEIEILERPLRGQTAQGERIALARSEVAPAGSSIEFEVQVLGGISRDLLQEWLDYGELRGLGGWRNASWGCFTAQMEQLS